MPCPFTGPKMFCAGPNILYQPKNLTAFSASSKTFVLSQKPILLNANHLFVWHKMFGTGLYMIDFWSTQKTWINPKFWACKRARHYAPSKFYFGVLGFEFLKHIFTCIRMYHERKDLSFLNFNCAYYLHCCWTVLCSGTFINCFRCSFFEEFLEKWHNHC